jgi:hypothetical protein
MNSVPKGHLFFINWGLVAALILMLTAALSTLQSKALIPFLLVYSGWRVS